MKKVRIYGLLLFIALTFNGCGVITLASTAFTIITTTQEVEEEHEGDFVEYVEETVEDTYDYLAEKIEEQ